MNLILLSGGSGQRLWPLSNAVRSKQFIKLFHTADGERESMIQRMCRMIHEADPAASVTVATAKAQVSAIQNQLGGDVGVSVEPCRRDTFPAIALAAAYLRDVRGVEEGATVVVCPVDPYVEADYFQALKELSRLASEDAARLTLMGIEPTYPSEKYGYILPEDSSPVSRVRTFREKPDEDTARRYIEQGALWNGGVFAFRLGWLLRRAHELLDFDDYQDLFARYAEQKKISFDYAVAEKEPSIQVMRFAGKWMDLGTWNTLTAAMEEPVLGQGTMDGTCENAYILNELDIPVLAMGLRNAVVSASPEGILVADLHQSSYIKPWVDAMEQRVMFAEKSWGSYQVLDAGEESLTIRVTLRPGNRMHYHSHQYRDEVWTVVSGTGRTIVDGMEQRVKPGDVVTMAAGCRHTVIAETELRLIEVQLGREISVHDKQKYPLE